MRQANMHEAKSQLSRLVDLALSGEDVVISRAGKPLVRLVPYKVSQEPRPRGVWRGKVRIASDFDELPEGLAAAFSGDSQ